MREDDKRGRCWKAIGRAQPGLLSVSGGYMKHRKMHVLVVFK